MTTVGDTYLSTLGDTQYHGRYHDACGGYPEYRRGCSVQWGDTVFVILVTSHY